MCAVWVASHNKQSLVVTALIHYAPFPPLGAGRFGAGREGAVAQVGYGLRFHRRQYPYSGRVLNRQYPYSGRV